MAKIYKVNGEILNIEPKNGTDFSWEELNSIVHGYIEIIRLGDGKIMVMNEEGKVYGLDINLYATNLLLSAGYRGDFVVGDVLVCRSDEVK